MGGNSASGAGLNLFVVPAEVGVAIRNRGMNFILCWVQQCLEAERNNQGRVVVVDLWSPS
jgi:hypothetical protein